jgi:hypothetical protein
VELVSLRGSNTVSIGFGLCLFCERGCGKDEPTVGFLGTKKAVPCSAREEGGSVSLSGKLARYQGRRLLALEENLSIST